jgi:hypothetical protein
MKPWRVWFSAVGASQEPRRPWAVQSPTGELYLAATVALVGKSAYRDTAFLELPGGPKGVMECSSVAMIDATRWVQG